LGPESDGTPDARTIYYNYPTSGPSTMLPVESLSFDPEALDGWVERGTL